ncbi:MAG: type II toxin-antitoxin system RelE/ParE family toxin [Candidatus Omnitrophica bacterium]|nr:type II toxin-antitoxin system RelE/ParE family toxin [Candidatus Omnitrophota bacterium]
MSYSVFWADRKVQKVFDQLSPLVQERVTVAIKGLTSNPRPAGTKKLSGKLIGVWRVRIGDFRLLYEIDDKSKRVVLLDLGHRRQIYR